MPDNYDDMSVQFWMVDIEDDVLETSNKIARIIRDMYNKDYTLLTSNQIGNKLVYFFIREKVNADNSK